MKRCFKCGVNKDLSDFYKHNRMADGHLNKCKECTKTDVKKNRDDNIEYYKSYDAWRFQNDQRVKDRHARYRGTDSCLVSTRISQRKWDERNSDAKYAHGVVARAVRSGKLEKPDTCPVCNEFTPSRKMHAHHEDYSKPLDIEWMCFKCHRSHHNPQNEGLAPIRIRGNTNDST